MHPHTEDAEEVEDPLTDILSKSAVDPGSDPGGGSGEGSGGPPAIITGAVASATGFATGGAVGMVMLAMLACTAGAMAWVTGGAGTNGAVMGGGGKEYGEGGTPIGIGVIRGGGGKFNCGGYWIGFRVWLNPGKWGKGIHTLHQPLAHLLLSMNVMGGDKGQVPLSSSSSVQLLMICASLSITHKVSIGNWRSWCLLTAWDMEITRLPSAIIIVNTCWCVGCPIQVVVFIIISANSWASCR